MFRKVGSIAVVFLALVGALYVVGLSFKHIDETLTERQARAYVEGAFEKTLTYTTPSDSAGLMAIELWAYVEAFGPLFPPRRQAIFQAEIKRLNALYIAGVFDKKGVIDGLRFCQMKGIPPMDALKFCRTTTYDMALKSLQWKLEDIERQRQEKPWEEPRYQVMQKDMTRWQLMLQYNTISPVEIRSGR